MKIYTSKILNRNIVNSNVFKHTIDLISKFFNTCIDNTDEFYYFINRTSELLLNHLEISIHNLSGSYKISTEVYALQLLFFLEGIINLNQSDISISKRIKKCLIMYLNYEEKLQFIKSFEFSLPCEIKNQIPILQKIYPEIFSFVDQDMIDKYLGQTFDKIYQIRISAVHKGLMPKFLLNGSTAISDNIKIYDKFSIRGKFKYIYFSSTMKLSFFEYVIKKTIWKHLNRNI